MLGLLRWVLLVPAALGAGVFGSFAGIVAGDAFGHAAVEAGSAFFGPFAFVGAAAVVAPSQRLKVCSAATSLVVLWSTFAIVEQFAQPLGRASILSPVAHVLGALYASFICLPFLTPAATLETLRRRIPSLGVLVGMFGAAVAIVGLVVALATDGGWFTFQVGLGVLPLAVITWLFPLVHRFVRVRKARRDLIVTAVPTPGADPQGWRWFSVGLGGVLFAATLWIGVSSLTGWNDGTSPVAARFVCAALGAVLAAGAPSLLFPARPLSATVLAAAGVCAVVVVVGVGSFSHELGPGGNYRAGVASGAAAGLAGALLIAALARPGMRRWIGVGLLSGMAGTLIIVMTRLPGVCHGLLVDTMQNAVPRIEDLIRTDMLEAITVAGWKVEWADECFGINAFAEASSDAASIRLGYRCHNPLWPASRRPGDLAGLRIARLWVILQPSIELGVQTPDSVRRNLLNLGVRAELIEQLSSEVGASAPTEIRRRSATGSAGDLYGSYHGVFFNVRTFPDPPGERASFPPRLDLWCTGRHQ